MRQVNYKRVVILSAEISNLEDDENSKRTENLRKCLHDLEISNNDAIGVYKNTVESVFVCLPKNDIEVKALVDLGLKSFNQECVLLQDCRGDASLTTDGFNKIPLGRIKQVPRVIAQEEEYYTVLHGEYYVAS